jgi:hypothetical protein
MFPKLSLTKRDLTNYLSTLPLQEVAKSLLRMGDGEDGVGRLEMRGKVMEVKAATPKGESASRQQQGRNQRNNRRRGSNHHHINHHHYNAAGQLLAPFAYVEPIGYHPYGGYYPHPTAYHYLPQDTQHGYDAAHNMYYPGGVYPQQHHHHHDVPHPVYSPMDQGMIGGQVASAAAQFYADPTTAVTGATMYASPPVSPYSQQTTAATAAAAYAFIPVVPMPHHGTVMQPVAPGIPNKPEEN